MKISSLSGALDHDLILLGNADVPVYLMEFSRNEWALIDAGVSRDLELIWTQLNQHIQSPKDVKYWLITHKHYDHCGLLSYLVPKLPSVQVLASNGTIASWKNPKVREVITTLNASLGFNTCIQPSTSLNLLPVKAISEGDILVLSDSHKLRVIAASGHSNDQVVFYDEEKQRLFSGDALGDFDDITKMWNPLIFDDTEAYISTLFSLKSLPIKQVLLGHGGMISGKGVNELISNIDKMTLKFIESIKTQLIDKDKEFISQQLHKRWALLSHSFVPNQLHLNSMRFMVDKISKHSL